MRLSVQQTFLAASAGRKKKAKVASAATTLVMYGADRRSYNSFHGRGLCGHGRCRG